MHKTNYSHSVKLVVLAALVLIVSGCTLTRLFVARVEKPTFTYLSYELFEVSQDRALVNFVFTAHNPNDVGLKDMLVSYELFAEGKQFLKGKDIDLELLPKSDTEIKVPAVIVYADLLPIVGSVAERIVSGQKTVPVTINAVFSKKTASGKRTGDERSLSFDMKMTRTVDVPLPLDRINRGMNILREILKHHDQ